MLSAVSSSWDSTLVAPAASLSPTFATSEVPPLGDDLVTTEDGLQFVASFLQQSGHAGQLQLDGLDPVNNLPSLEEPLPSIDESLFDLVGVPDLEEITHDGLTLTNNAVPHLNCNQLFDDIPALEDVPDHEVHWPSWVVDEVAPTSETITTNAANTSITAAVLQQAPRLTEVLPPLGVLSTSINTNETVVTTLSTPATSPSPVPLTSTTVTTPTGPKSVFILEDHDEIAIYEEEVNATEVPGYLEVGLASPASVCSAAGSTTSGVSGDVSPIRRSSAGTLLRFSDDLPTIPAIACYPYGDKKRRVSQASVASSVYSSMGSPTSSSGLASDSDNSETPRRVKAGRRSRFSPEDRKERKKAQNRTAAERYRQKRRQAEEVIGEEEQQLMDANGALRIEVTKLEAELSCMKRLMREMLRSKGIDIPAGPPSAKKAKTCEK